ncbi:uncharacterized protein BXZ73DRAFT_103159 [Epithele typhae]|uniref:uncharacterized protein n=1 Tax=Epithele typhae TaxID=378194 RepID=UPI0020088F33|nr:uncharacterized protein BXZ73DRAFT_103159 [Epithele typhae]KAH9925621.1 hypothetical protein BXZ73DRAFT_103159 [Epithele typhae]
MTYKFILVLHEKFLQNFLHVNYCDNLRGLTPGLKMQTSVEVGAGEACRPEDEDDADEQTICLTWADQVVPIEFKQDKSYLDPFDDRDENGTVRSRKKVREQLAHYAETVLVEQHRTFLFFIFVLGANPLHPWDQSGVIVTPLVDYYDDWETTCRLPSAYRIPRLSQSHGEESDTTTPPDRPTWIMKSAISGMTRSPTRRLHVRLRPDAVPQLYPDGTAVRAPGPRRKRHAHAPRRTPRVHRWWVVGRFTRGYIGYDEKTDQFYWLKDTWRADYKRLAKEGDTLKRLQEAGVKNIPTLVCHGDINKQVTRTHDFCGLCSSSLLRKSTDSTACKRKLREFKASQGVAHDDEINPDFDGACPLRRHRHYRLCVKEIGRPLESFTSPRQFVRIMHDAGSAHRTAFNLANTLHRDISGGNIIIFPRVRGTRQFMSITMLLGSGKVSEVSDDLESLFYVTLYYLVRYVPSNIRTSEDIFRWLEDIFDCYAVNGNMYTCGSAKKNASYKLGGELAIDDDTSLCFQSPLDKLINTLHLALKNFYQLKRWEKQQRLLKPVDTSLESALAARRLGPDVPSSSPVADDGPGEDYYDVDEDEDDAAAPTVAFAGASGPIPEPDVRERTSASVFQDHSVFLQVYKTCMGTSGSLWGKRNKLAADRLPQDSYSTRPLVPSLRPSGPHRATAHGFEDGKSPKRRMSDESRNTPPIRRKRVHDS